MAGRKSPKKPSDFEFVLGRETRPGQMTFVRGCYTERELRELYRAWLIQRDEDSVEHLPYRRYEGRLYVPMMGLAFEVEEEVKNKLEADEPNRWVM